MDDLETRWTRRWNADRNRWERWWIELRRADGSVVPAKKFTLMENVAATRFFAPLFTIVFLVCITALPIWYYRLQGRMTWNLLWFLFAAACAWRYLLPSLASLFRKPDRSGARK